MTTAPLVSICIPNYNNAAFLTQSIGSVLAQSVQDFEIVVCDNASTDESMSVLASIPDARLRVYQNERNLGIYGNLERIMTLARGRYIKVLAADDWLHPLYLEKTLALFDRYPDVGLVTVRMDMVADGDGRLLGTRLEPVTGVMHYTIDRLLDASLDRSNPLGNPTRVIFLRAAFDRAGGWDTTNEHSGELDLWLRMILDYAAAAVPEVLAYERIHQAQTTNLNVRAAKDIRDICAAYAKHMALYPVYWTTDKRRAFVRGALRSYIAREYWLGLMGQPERWLQARAWVSSLLAEGEWLPYYRWAAPEHILRHRAVAFAQRLLALSRQSLWWLRRRRDVGAAR